MGALIASTAGLTLKHNYRPEDGLQVLPIADDLNDVTAYISGGAVQPKVAFLFVVSTGQITANGTDESIISSIPEASKLNGQTVKPIW